jgi:hypothetical protein
MKWLEAVTSAVVAIVNDPYAVLFCCIGIAFVLLSSVLNIRNLMRGARSDYAAAMTYFVSFFGLMFALPMALVLIDGPKFGMYPWTLGLQIGEWKIGLTMLAVCTPILALTVVLGARDPALHKQYPFSKEALRGPVRFAVYEAVYVAFYYLAWEFAFRGVVLFGLLAFLPVNIPGVAVAIMVQTFLSTIYHIGHPNSEVVGAFLLGLVSGAAAVATGSIFYGLLSHAVVGVLNDCIAYRRFARSRT